jgi:hypothetical protein
MPPLGTDFALRFAFKRTKNGVSGNYKFQASYGNRAIFWRKPAKVVDAIKGVFLASYVGTASIV